eukprot:277047_1
MNLPDISSIVSLNEQFAFYVIPHNEKHPLQYSSFTKHSTKTLIHMTSVCHVCNAATSNVCSGCKRVRYCNVNCQRQDWKRHKKECKKWRQELHQNKTEIKESQEEVKCRPETLDFEQKVQYLSNMGFTISACVKSLTAVDYHVDKAVAYLKSHNSSNEDVNDHEHFQSKQYLYPPHILKSTPDTSISMHNCLNIAISPMKILAEIHSNYVNKTPTKPGITIQETLNVLIAAPRSTEGKRLMKSKIDKIKEESEETKQILCDEKISEHNKNECDGNISQCQHLLRLQAVFSQYNKTQIIVA